MLNNNIGTLKIQQEFQDAIAQAGMTPPINIELGEIIRFSDNGEKNKNGWCILYINQDGSYVGIYGNWRTGSKEKWFDKEREMTQEQRACLEKQIQEGSEKARQEQEKRHRKAADRAKDTWGHAGPVSPDHYYLIKKQIKPYGLKQSDKCLLVPVMDDQSKICSLQKIFPDGKKRFLSGGRTKGCFFFIGETTNPDTIYACEGWATGSTIHEVTNKPVVVAFNSGNLLSVTQTIKKKYPDAKLVICADNDLATEKKQGNNPGRKAAEKAASVTGAEICLSPVDSDFNDLYCSQGRNTVEEALKKTTRVRKKMVLKNNAKRNHSQEPLPLERKVEKADPFPLYALGDILGPAAEIMNKVVKAPDGLCAHSVIGFAAHAVQGFANVNVDGRVIPLNEFFLTIGSRSARKSECDNKAGIVHKKQQWQELKKYEKKKRAYLDEQRVYEDERKKIFYDKNNSAEKNEALEALRKKEPARPHEPLILFSDPTIEGIHGLFVHGTPSKYLCADEGGQVSGGHSMTTEKKVYTATTYSKWWDAAPIDRVRGGDGSSVLYGRRLSMHLMMQDQIAMEFFNDPVMKNQGMLSRFLVTFPESLAGTRQYDERNISESPAMQEYYERTEAILQTSLPLKTNEETKDELNELEPRVIYLDADAKECWVNVYNEIENKSGKDGIFKPIEGFAGKAGNHMIRLAGIMALFDDVHRESISKEYMERAGILMEYYLNERLRLVEMAEPNMFLERAKSLLEWLQKNRLKTVTLTDIYQRGPTAFRNKEQAAKGIAVLEDHNWLTKCESGGVSKFTSKKSKEAWIVTHAKI